jgi:hypothetical protein
LSSSFDTSRGEHDGKIEDLKGSFHDVSDPICGAFLAFFGRSYSIEESGISQVVGLNSDSCVIRIVDHCRF